MDPSCTINRAFPLKGALPPGTYLVGGAVRDTLLGRSPHDWDLIVARNFQRTARDLAHRLRAHLVPLGKPGQPLIRLITPGAALDLTPQTGSTLEADLKRRDFTINAMAWNLSRGTLVDPLKGRDDLGAGIIRRVSPSAVIKDPVRLLRAYRLAAQLHFRIEPGGNVCGSEFRNCSSIPSSLESRKKDLK